ncbi:hypothetical protein J2Y43_002831 [Dyadobacter sp. BE31]|nr:hypothetical protein [Dyadobacter sp. BE31]
MLYAVACKNCGNHILFSLPSRRAKLTEFLMLGEQTELRIETRIDPSFKQMAEKYGHCYSVPAVLPDFTKSTGFAKERDMEILYEMLGEGEIDLDMFNKLSAKLAIR